VKSKLQEFVDDVETRRQRSNPEIPMQGCPKELLYAAAEFIQGAIAKRSQGGRNSRGHRYKGIPDEQLSQSPRARRERARRRQAKGIL
jgi:hypothetical protein